MTENEIGYGSYIYRATSEGTVQMNILPPSGDTALLHFKKKIKRVIMQVDERNEKLWLEKK